jgi:hypothetical protein
MKMCKNVQRANKSNFTLWVSFPCRNIERSIEFVIKVGAGIEGIGLFESIHLFVYKLMIQNAISGVKRRVRLFLEQNGEHFQHLL